MGLRILVVEDEALIAMALSLQLERAGHRVCARVARGEAVLDAVRNHEPDLIVMDIHLSGAIDGIEAASKAREISPAPVIFVSGYDSDELRERVAAIAPAGFLSKPLVYGELLALIEASPR